MESFATISELPAVIPVFPLSGAILLPRALLPLNIFEPRYLAMTRDAMAGDRLIGIIQPKGDGGAGPPELFGTGGLGRITRFSETGDGRYLIALAGIIRFHVTEEVGVATPYRQVRADYAPFVQDWNPAPPLPAMVRASLEDSLRAYLETQNLAADWDAVRGADDEGLVSTLATVCPFEILERQALLEAPDLEARASMLTALMRFAGTVGGSTSATGTLQ
ncbi:LON peptidase substrate-binding domain-containing protein [Thermaurantiacus sp.]